VTLKKNKLQLEEIWHCYAWEHTLALCSLPFIAKKGWHSERLLPQARETKTYKAQESPSPLLGHNKGNPSFLKHFCDRNSFIGGTIWVWRHWH